jgi:hypothetical protein
VNLWRLLDREVPTSEELNLTWTANKNCSRKFVREFAAAILVPDDYDAVKRQFGRRTAKLLMEADWF